MSETINEIKSIATDTLVGWNDFMSRDIKKVFYRIVELCEEIEKEGEKS